MNLFAVPYLFAIKTNPILVWIKKKSLPFLLKGNNSGGMDGSGGAVCEMSDSNETVG